MTTDSSHWWLAVPITFSVLDNLANIIGLGFYHTNFNFNVTAFEEQLLFTNGYSFLSSGFEFVLLSFIRLVFFSVGIFLIFRRLPLIVFDYVLLIADILAISFSLVKLLCFSEIESQLKFPGVWISIFGTMIFAIAHFTLWFVYIKKHKREQDGEGYTRMAENGHVPGLQNNEEQPQPASEQTATEAEQKEPKLDRSTAMNLVGKILEYAWLHKWWFFGGFVFLMVYSGARIFIPYYTGQVIAEIVGAEGKTEHDFLRLILIMLALTALSTIFGGLRGGFFEYATYLVDQSMRRDLFRSIVRQEIAFFDKAQTGEIISRLSSDCQTVSSVVSTNINIFMRNMVMLVGALVFMFLLSWRLALITFIAIPPIAFVTKIYGEYFDKLSEKTQETIAEANRVAEESIGSMRTVRSFACENKEAERFEDRLQKTLEISKKKAVAYLGYTWINELSENIILVAVLFYAGHLAMKGQLTVNEVTSFLLYQMQLGENFYSINYVFSGLMESVGASRKVFEYISRQPTIKYEGTNEQPIKGEVIFDSVNFAYPTRSTTEVLKNLTLNISAGQTVALVGPSGAGKSSVISLLEHFYETSSGRILVDGVEITQYKHGHYHQQVSLVSQEPVLYSGTIRYNILYGCEWADDSHMIEAAKLANAHDFISDLEHGYNTKCGEKGVMMSGGQKQRIAIARALVRNPSILILDEATSALDTESEHIIQQALQKCSVGRTVIIIAHRLSTVENSDVIYVINKGEVVQQGNHKKLMGEEGLYKTLVQRQLLNSETSTESNQASS
ncbi:Antigen peptide transporter 2 [Aphelenchoides bicaudatus]|nr:Antigen peptide transporter 2 [Aphelenchoides bicaudatus]